MSWNFFFLCLYKVWFYFGIVGSFMFILIQLILLIDFAHSWNEVWVRNAEEGNGKCWYFSKGLILFNYKKKILFLWLLFLGYTYTCGLIWVWGLFVYRSPLLYHPALCPGFYCCGAFLFVLHQTWQLHRAQGLHQSQPHLLYHRLRGVHPAQSTGMITGHYICWCYEMDMLLYFTLNKKGLNQ